MSPYLPKLLGLNQPGMKTYPNMISPQIEGMTHEMKQSDETIDGSFDGSVDGSFDGSVDSPINDNSSPMNDGPVDQTNDMEPVGEFHSIPTIEDDNIYNTQLVNNTIVGSSPTPHRDKMFVAHGVESIAPSQNNYGMSQNGFSEQEELSQLQGMTQPRRHNRENKKRDRSDTIIQDKHDRQDRQDRQQRVRRRGKNRKDRRARIPPEPNVLRLNVKPQHMQQVEEQEQGDGQSQIISQLKPNMLEPKMLASNMLASNNSTTVISNHFSVGGKQNSWNDIPASDTIDTIDTIGHWLIRDAKMYHILWNFCCWVCLVHKD